MSDGTDVLRAIDQLRRDLSGYHGQLKAHNDLQRHCDNQRERIGELEGLYANAKAERDEANMAFSKEHDRAEFLMRENAKLRELVRMMLRVAGVAEYATDIEWQTITHYLRELGIEVDG